MRFILIHENQKATYLFCEVIAMHEVSSKSVQETRLYGENQIHIFL